MTFFLVWHCTYVQDLGRASPNWCLVHCCVLGCVCGMEAGFRPKRRRVLSGGVLCQTGQLMGMVLVCLVAGNNKLAADTNQPGSVHWF